MIERDGHLLPRGVHPAIPDWKIYKVADCPELLSVEKELAAYGLKSPWLRNHVWRYDVKTNGTLGWRIRMGFFRGLKWGTILAVTHASIKYWLSDKEHHHPNDEPIKGMVLYNEDKHHHH